jgi:tetratricopeptide (TPR) repeat protein
VLREALAETLAGRGDHAGAVEALRGALPRRGSPAPLSERGEALRLSELLAAELLTAGGAAPVAEAVDLRRQVLSAYAAPDPLGDSALAAAARLALALEQAGDEPGARAVCEALLGRARAEAARQAPDAAATAHRVAVHLAWAGDMARAEEAFRLAHAGLTAAPGDAPGASLALVGLSHARLAQGNIDEAEAAARQAWDLVARNAGDSGRGPAAVARAEVLAAQGRRGEAVALLRDAAGRGQTWWSVFDATEDNYMSMLFRMDRATAAGAVQEAATLCRDFVVLAQAGLLDTDADAARRVWRAARPVVAATRTGAGADGVATDSVDAAGGPARFDARTRLGELRARWMLAASRGTDQPRRPAARSAALFAWGPDEVERLGRILQARPDDPDVLASRASFLGRLGRHREALADFERAVQLQPCRHQAWIQLLALRLYLGDAEGHRRDAATAVRIFGDSGIREVCDRIAKAVAVGERPPDLDRLTAMVDRAVAPGENPHRAWFHVCKALVEYRRGNYQAALDWSDDHPDDADPPRVAYRDVLRAMAQHRLGRTEAARAQLAQASRWIDARGNAPGQDDPGGDIHDCLNPLTLRREAEALILGVSGPPAAKEPRLAPGLPG